jgi:hypothetical protein
MLNLLVQGGDKKSGWRYSPRKGQSELLDLLVAKLPHYVVEVNDRSVWWKVFTPEAEAVFLADVAKVTGGNFEIETGGSPMKKEVENPYIGGDVLEFIDELVEEMDNLPFDKNKILSRLAGEFYKPDKLEWLGDNGVFALVYFPVLQTTRQKEKIYFYSKVIKVELATMEEKVVFDGSTGQRLGKNRRQELIKEELG